MATIDYTFDPAGSTLMDEDFSVPADSTPTNGIDPTVGTATLTPIETTAEPPVGTATLTPIETTAEPPVGTATLTPIKTTAEPTVGTASLTPLTSTTTTPELPGLTLPDGAPESGTQSLDNASASTDTELPGLEAIDLSPTDYGLTVPAGAKELGDESVLTAEEEKLRQNQLSGSLDTLTAFQQEQMAQSKMDSARANYAKETRTAIANNLRSKHSTDILTSIRDINNSVYGAAVDRANSQDVANLELFEETWDRLMGTPEGRESALAFGTSLGVDPSFLKALAENPGAWARLADEKYTELTAENQFNAGEFLLSNLDGSTDERALATNLQGFVNSRWNSDMGALMADASTWIIDQEAIDRYEAQFGEVDATDPNNKAMIYAFDVMADEAQKVFQVISIEDIGRTLASQGYEVDESTLKQIEAITSTFGEEVGEDFMDTLNDGPGGVLDFENGVSSIYVTDWAGNSVTGDASTWQAYQDDPVQQGMNDVWLQYNEDYPTSTLTRDEFYDYATAYSQENRIPISNISPRDAIKIATNMIPTDEMSVEELMLRAESSDWWDANVVSPAKAGYENNGSNWSTQSQLKDVYEENGWVEGAVMDIGGDKIMMSELTSYLDTEGDNKFRVYVTGVNLTTGETYGPKFLKSHDTA